MGFNLIDAYFNNKVDSLSRIGLLFYPKNDEKFILFHFNIYFRTYVNFCFYDVVDTLNEKMDSDLISLKNELNGKRLEALYNYSSNELELSNEEYANNVFAISEMCEIALFIITIDQLRFESKKEITEFVLSFLEKFVNIKNKLNGSTQKFIDLICNMYDLEQTIFKDCEPLFYVDYTDILRQDKLIYVKLEYNIKAFKTDYDRKLVDMIYSTPDLALRKTEILFYKLSREILTKTLDSVLIEDCIIEIGDNMFKDGELLIKKWIDSYILKKHIIFGVKLDTYLSNKEFLDKFGYRCACIDNLAVVDNPIERLKSIKKIGAFSCIVVTNYNNGDYDKINNYRDMELFFTRSD